ncbi:hypothetical protein TNCV_2888881 [Trichonephila clavipes]|nr:hypothetical protein TNCV_2888881 [Trichonephila clavipes]
MEIPLRTAYGQNGRCDMQPKPSSLRAQAHQIPARISSQSSSHCWRSPLPHASALIQRDFECVIGVQQTKQLPHAAKVDLVWHLGCNLGQSLSNHGPHVFYR